ncbi:flavo protein [Lepidopterella palustris CBS 459.81]|uniref:Flavo protein n=1 Tax=Lepidopterella palustris CBS 459.81 TaxID=1314670 RepID=A0A8E2E8Z9_9PEZI|nr:flavo protein [Lepidopterella palustris CBS 459.81]
MPILIIYASPHGSTRAIAERISSRIASQIPPTEVHALSDIDPATLSSYTAIVIGSAVHKVAWLHDATTFVHANSTALANLPVFAFSVGAPAGMPKFVRARFERSEEKRLEGAVEKELKSGKATLEAHKLFNGKFEREDAGWCVRTMFACFGGRFGDFTDWDTVDKWADTIVAKLNKPVTGEGEGGGAGN